MVVAEKTTYHLKSNNIGLLVPRINRNFFANIIHGIESITNANGYNLIICQSNESANEEATKIQALINAQVAGIIISVSTQTHNDDEICKIIDQKIPLVGFDRVHETLNINKVINDNELGSYDATTHLIEKGYKKIAYFTGPLHLHNYKYRFNGYKRALLEHGMEINEAFIYENVITEELGIVATRELLMLDEIPDAICSAGDYSALGALSVVKDRGIRVPHEMGITGFANEPFTNFITPSLTTLEQYSVDMGKTAANLLLQQIASPEAPVKTIVIKPKLILRESTNII